MHRRILFAVAFVFALSLTALGQSAPPLQVGEIDLSPKKSLVYKLEFPNGSLTPITGGFRVAFPSGVGGDVTHTAGDLTLNRLVIGNAGADLKASNVVITNPASAATFTLTAGKTFSVSNTLTLAGTDSSTLNIGAGGTLGSNALPQRLSFLRHSQSTAKPYRGI